MSFTYQARSQRLTSVGMGSCVISSIGCFQILAVPEVRSEGVEILLIGSARSTLGWMGSSIMDSN